MVLRELQQGREIETIIITIIITIVIRKNSNENKNNSILCGLHN